MTPEDFLEKTKAMEKVLVKVNTMEVAVGITKESATKAIYGEVDADGNPDPNAPSVLEVGAAHEFGVGVPERSFLRATWIEKEKEINKLKKNLFLKMTEQTMTVKDGFDFLGVELRNFSKEAFIDGGFGEWEALSAKTIALKGHDKILSDTRTLLRSVDFETRKIDNAA